MTALNYRLIYRLYLYVLVENPSLSKKVLNIQTLNTSHLCASVTSYSAH